MGPRPDSRGLMRVRGLAPNICQTTVCHPSREQTERRLGNTDPNCPRAQNHERKSGCRLAPERTFSMSERTWLKAGRWFGARVYRKPGAWPQPNQHWVPAESFKGAECWLRVECLTAPATPSRGAVESSWVLWCPFGAHRRDGCRISRAAVCGRWPGFTTLG